MSAGKLACSAVHGGQQEAYDSIAGYSKVNANNEARMSHSTLTHGPSDIPASMFQQRDASDEMEIDRIA
jgi:hypothetical protein